MDKPGEDETSFDNQNIWVAVEQHKKGPDTLWLASGGGESNDNNDCSKESESKDCNNNNYPFPFPLLLFLPCTIANPSSSIGIPHHQLIVIFPMVVGCHHHQCCVPPLASLTVWGVLDLVVAGVNKGRCINGGTDGSSAPVANSLRCGLLQRGKDGGDLSGGGKRSIGIGRGGGLPSPSSAGQG